MTTTTKLRKGRRMIRTMPTLTIATFNVNGITTHLDDLIEWLGRESPDIVCLQELKSTDQAFPARALREAGYRAIWRGESRWNGVAILSRHAEPIETRRSLPGLEDDPQARYLEAAVHGILVGCLYLPNGNPIRGASDHAPTWVTIDLAKAKAKAKVNARRRPA